MTEYHVGDTIRFTSDDSFYDAYRDCGFVVLEVDTTDETCPVLVDLPGHGSHWPHVGNFVLEHALAVAPTIPGLKVERDEDGDLAVVKYGIEPDRLKRLAQLIDPDGTRSALNADGVDTIWMIRGTESQDLRDIAAVYLAFAEAIDADAPLRQLSEETGLGVAEIERLKALGYTITKEA